ncbi:MAG: hypothetical protein HY939_05425 [Gammaproteobacteria bacterium]|nr:hypothetical protein [Gammaproteobacteria bacterium]
MLKNITLSADEKLLQKSREKALKNKKTLNALFREWLEEYTCENSQCMDYKDLMKQLHYAKVGKKFSRESLNER